MITLALELIRRLLSFSLLSGIINKSAKLAGIKPAVKSGFCTVEDGEVDEDDPLVVGVASVGVLIPEVGIGGVETVGVVSFLEVGAEILSGFTSS